MAGGYSGDVEGSGSRHIRPNLVRRGRTANTMKRFLTTARLRRLSLVAAIVVILLVFQVVQRRPASVIPAWWLPQAGLFALWLILAVYGLAVAMVPILIGGPLSGWPGDGATGARKGERCSRRWAWAFLVCSASPFSRHVPAFI